MSRKKHVPISIPIDGGGTCVAHVDPDASPEFLPALKTIAQAAYRQAREESRLEAKVCAAAILILECHEMDPVPCTPGGAYDQLLARARELRDFRYRKRRTPKIESKP